MTNSYFSIVFDPFISAQVTALGDAIDIIKQLDQSNVGLQQKVNHQTQELKQKSQQLDRILAESQHINKHLVQVEKMAMLGQMVAGIAHEINNPINFIYGNLPYVEEHVHDLLKVLRAYQVSCVDGTAALKAVLDEVELDFVVEDLPRIVESMKLGTDRIRELVLTLRSFYRLDEAEMKPANLHEGIEHTLLLLQHRYKQNIQIIEEFGEIPLVECHINQINQVFMNLLSNAIDALMEPTPAAAPLIETTPIVKQIAIKTQLTKPGWVAISICDNGPGVPLAIQNRLFEAFFTTKPIGIGTGLGLSISHQIITKTHQGRIYCCSAPEGGTTFMVELPIRQSGETGRSHQGLG